MNILLIKPATIYQPIGLAYLSPYLLSSNFKVEIIDYVVNKYTEDRLIKELEDKKPEIIGITSITPFAFVGLKIAKLAKETLQDSYIVFGGPHATAAPLRVIKEKGIDCVVMGEGERTFSELVKAIKYGKNLGEIKGLIYKGDNEIKQNEPRELISNIDEIPYPAYHLFPVEKYFEYPDMHGLITKNKRFMPVLSSRGCPYKCIYCHETLGKVFRPRSPENFLGELEMLYHKYGIREFHIEDDTFNVNIDRAKIIMDEIVGRELNVSIQFPSGLRCDRMDEDLVIKMKKAGTFMIALGIETASPRVMKFIKKNLNLEKVKEAVNLITKHKIQVWGYFMIGFPYETMDEIYETINFAKSLNLTYASFSIVTPLPGTELFNIAIKEGYICEDEYFESTSINYSTPLMKGLNVTQSELVSLKKEAIRKFYLNPKRIFRLLFFALRSRRNLSYYFRKFKKNILGIWR